MPATTLSRSAIGSPFDTLTRYRKFLPRPAAQDAAEAESGSGTEGSQEEVRQSVLRLRAVRRQDAGLYQCFGHSDSGDGKAAVLLKVGLTEAQYCDVPVMECFACFVYFCISDSDDFLGTFIVGWLRMLP